MSEVPTWISGLPTYTKNTVHLSQKSVQNQSTSSVPTHVISSDASSVLTHVITFDTSSVPTYVGTSDASASRGSKRARCRDFRRTSSVPTRVGTSDASASRGSKRARCRDFRRMSSVPTCVISSDARRDFRHHKSYKTILRAGEVLECLSFDLVLILEHSIFLRPTKFASLFIVRHILKLNIKSI